VIYRIASLTVYYIQTILQPNTNYSPPSTSSAIFSAKTSAPVSALPPNPLRHEKELTNHTLRMPRWQHRRSTHVHDPQSLHPNNPRPRIHHRHPVLASPHPTRTTRMPILISRLHNILQDVFIACNVGTGLYLFYNNGLHSARIEEAARALECLYGDLAVRRVAELIWVHEGQVACGC
jgi:hypothetical protein